MAMLKPQLIDIVRAHAIRIGAPIAKVNAAVDIMTVSQLESMVATMRRNGTRISAHLTKTKTSGYGFLTFGSEGHTATGGPYHRINVSSAKHARRIAKEFETVPWNF